MSTYYKYAQFDSCTPLSAAEMDFTFNLTWTLPDTDIYKYKKIEIYRYIGDLNTGITNPTETDVHSELIYTATQSFDIDMQYINTVTIEKDYFNGNKETTTQSTIITAVNQFTDNLQKYNNTNTTLKSNHNITDVVDTDDTTILTDIIKTKRCLYYIMITYINGVYDAVPYCVASHMYTGILDNTSTKTQVRHDMLHFEGDLIWATWLVGAAHGVGRGISRTAVDLNSIYLNRDSSDYGPTGRGGLAWVSDRTTGNVFRCNLNNGLQNARYNNIGQRENPGHGICIDPATGDCISSSMTTGAYSNTIRCKTNSISVSADETTPDGPTSTLSTNLPPVYGMVNIPKYGTKFAISSPWYWYGATPNVSITNLTTNNASVTYTHGLLGGYGICSGPDGTIYEAPYNYYWYGAVVKNPLSPIYGDITSGLIHSITCTTDNYTMWPNKTGFNTKYHVIYGGLENGYLQDVSVDTTKSIGTTIDPTTLMQYSTFSLVQQYPTEARTFRGVGIDGENNIWGIGVGRVKIYRVEAGTDYPLQGSCRYPSIDLDNQPITYTNTREIEWFLQRDSGYENSTLGVSGIGTLDNTYKTMFNGVSTTAHKAWWSLVDDGRFEIAPLSNSGSGIKYPTGGFDVVKPNGDTSLYTKTYGIRMKDYTTNYAGTLTAIDNWYNTFANTQSNLYYGGNNTLNFLASSNLNGRRVFPWYGTADSNITSAYTGNLVTTYANTYNPNFANIGEPAVQSYTITFNNWHGYAYCYSDFTGNLLLGSVESSPINKSLINPEPTDPDFISGGDTFIIDLTGSQSNNGYQETFPLCYPWKNVVTTNTGISGYDNLTINGTVTANTGTYDINEIHLFTDDYDLHSDTIINNISDIYPINHTYNDPSKVGLYYLPSGNPQVTEYLHDKKAGGTFTPYVYISALDIYNNTVLTATASTSVVVLERWPEAKLYFDAADLTTNRRIVFTNNTWGYDRFDKSSSIRKESRSSDAKRYDTTYGVDPISGILRDRSIARTYPISSWHISLSTNNPYVSWYSTGTALTLTQNSTALYVGADEQNFYDELTRFNFRYGDYVVTMNVAASTTATSGDKIFTNYIQVDEFEPFANFWPISGYTVSPNYTNDAPTQISAITGQFPNGNNAIYPFVSGYAPNMTVYFQDSSEAHTFPISEYNWNFGDYYNEGTVNVYATDSNYYTVTTNTIQSGTFDNPNWKTDVTAHTAVHTYTMPGTYDVTLTVKASTTNTTDLCARYTGNDTVQKFNVYVQEIPPMFIEAIKASDSPICSATTDFSGIAPKTYYFCGSGIMAGSFPICKMVWDFGDGTIETITRTPSSIVTKQGLALTYHADPRFTIVPHIYSNNTADAQIYSIGVSAYACNTNTMITTGVSNLIGPLSNAYVNLEEKRKLIGSRFDSDGNMVYVFEGLITKNTYTVVMSGVI